MPRRSFSDRFHGVWDRVTRRHGRGRDQQRHSPQLYADTAAARHQSQNRASRLTRGTSLPNLLDRVALDRSPQRLPLDRESLWNIPAPTLSHAQSHSSDSVGFGTFLGELERKAPSEEQHYIPTAVITARDTGSINEEADGPPWKLPDQDFFPESQRQAPSHPRTGLFSSSQPKDRKLELDVFSLLLEVLVSPNGLVGIEDRLNLPLLLAALSYALSNGMTYEIEKLKSTIDRYIPLRMFHHNPHTSSSRLEFEYYEFRSEEIYRAWQAVSRDERLCDYLSPSEAVTLYIHLVPHWWWYDWIIDYDQKFMVDTKIAWANIDGDPGSRFELVFRGFFNRARLGLHSWMKDTAVSG
ncbi:hypothetical protein IL306_009213 [Fusarium sp. DS 682]|nr:hypothetical protein IL306_009213 [Fusarium sp. DS 682]